MLEIIGPERFDLLLSKTLVIGDYKSSKRKMDSPLSLFVTCIEKPHYAQTLLGDHVVFEGPIDHLYKHIVGKGGEIHAICTDPMPLYPDYREKDLL